MRLPRAPQITETQEHEAIAGYFAKVGYAPGVLGFHIRNERGSAWERKVAAQMGVLSGIPDWLFLFDGDALFIELKPRGFKQKLARGIGLTEHVRRQLATHDKIRACNVPVEIAETLDELLEILWRYGVRLRTESITTERLRRGFEGARG